MKKLSITDLELMDNKSNYDINPLLDGLEDMNSEVKDTVASLALDRFGFTMDKLAETKNYPYSTKEEAVESVTLMNDKDVDKYELNLSKASLEKAREFCAKVGKLAQEYNLPVFVVTSGASLTRNNNNEAIRRCREALIKYETEVGSDPNEDWMRNK